MDDDVAVESLEEVQIDNEYDKYDSESENESIDNGNTDDEVINVNKNRGNYDDPDDSGTDNEKDDSDEENDDNTSCNEDSAEELDESAGQSILQGALRSQKRSTIKQDGDIKITPFNIREEMEEGQFDSDGNYIFAKKKRIDNWEKSIDWDKIEKNQNEPRAGPSNSRSASNQETSQETPILCKLDCYKQMLRIMRHEETVQRCIRRLGDSIPKRRPNRMKPSKSKNNESSQTMDIDREAEIKEVKSKMDRMSELVNQRVQDGDLDIYSRTYEDLEDAIN